MALRPNEDKIRATIKDRNVSVGVTAYTVVKRAAGASDTDVMPAGVGDDQVADGVAEFTRVAGQRVSVVTYESGGKTQVRVGTGGVTHGKRVKIVANGVADAADDVASCGVADQTGVVGDLVGMQLLKS
jgi:hypothetical protein